MYEYKYVVIDFATKQPVMWQSGGNAVLAVDLSETKLDVKDNWCVDQTTPPAQRMTQQQAGTSAVCNHHNLVALVLRTACRNNEPGAEVRSDGQTGQAVTRESKLQKWAG